MVYACFRALQSAPSPASAEVTGTSQLQDQSPERRRRALGDSATDSHAAAAPGDDGCQSAVSQLSRGLDHGSVASMAGDKAGSILEAGDASHTHVGGAYSWLAPC